jgi:tetratricopeptide (TPR) repeat protein
MVPGTLERVDLHDERRGPSLMRLSLSPIAIVALLAVPAHADRKLDEAVAKAQEQLQKGKPEEAIKTMRKIASQSDQGTEAQIKLAEFLERVGEKEEALDTLKSASQAGSGTGKAETLAALSMLEIRMGPARAALAHAEQATQLASTPRTLAALARVQARLDPVKALETAEKAVAAGPNDPDAHFAMGAALLAHGRYADSAAAFRKSLQLDPGSAAARTGLAAALTGAGKATEAVAEARKAVEADPNRAEAHSILAAAIIAENPKNWTEAIAEAQDGAFKNDKNPDVHYVVGNLFDADGRFDQAAQAYQRALSLDPEFTAARAALIKSQFRRGDLDGALKEALKLAEEAPTSGEAQLQAGELLLRKGDNAAAIAPLEKAVKLLSGSADANYYLGRAYQFTGRPDDALAPYKKAVELNPQNLDFRTTYGLLLGVNGKPQEGIVELKKVVSTPGYKDTAGYTNLGWLYRNLEPPNTAESVAAYKKALELDPKNAQAALGLGWAHSYAKNWDACIPAYQKAIELDSKLAAQGYNGMAWAYLSKRDFAQARSAFNKAQQAGGGDARLDDILDKVEERQRQGIAFDAKAQEEVEKAQTAAREAQKKLDRLNDALESPNAATRSAAVKGIVALVGADAVPTLTWMLVNDKAYSVRIDVARALGSLGPAGRKACPHLKSIANTDVPTDPLADKAKMLQQMEALDFQKACRDAAARCGC